MKIYASKNIGKVYYMVKDPYVIVSIENNNVIQVSEKSERGYEGGGAHKYVSLMRSLDKAGRNPNKWTYGIQIDGTRLSDKYKIIPYSMPYHNMRGKGGHFRVIYLSEYDDGTYILKLVNRPAFKIPKYVFDDIENSIISDVDDCKDKKKLTKTTNKRKYAGKSLVVQYLYNVPSGGMRINENTVSDTTLSFLQKHTMLNETEERIWVIDTNAQYIDIKGLITGYIEPKGDNTIESFIDEGLIADKPIYHYH